MPLNVGSSYPVYANSAAYGLIYKWNITRRYAIRAGVMTSELKSYDFYAQDLSRFNRFFKSTIACLSFQLVLK